VGEYERKWMASFEVNTVVRPYSSLLLSSLELSDTKSMSLKYEPASEPLHISAPLLHPLRCCRANVTHKIQSGSDSGHGFLVKGLVTF